METDDFVDDKDLATSQTAKQEEDKAEASRILSQMKGDSSFSLYASQSCLMCNRAQDNPAWPGHSLWSQSSFSWALASSYWCDLALSIHPIFAFLWFALAC